MPESRYGRPAARYALSSSVRNWDTRRTYSSSQIGTPQVVLEQLHPVQPGLDVRTFRYDARTVPFPHKVSPASRLLARRIVWPCEHLRVVLGVPTSCPLRAARLPRQLRLGPWRPCLRPHRSHNTNVIDF